MKQGNSPETATASGFRAELRQEENAGWDTWERKAETATEHSRNTTGIAWQRPPSLKWWQQLKRPKESNKPWKQVRGGSQLLPSLSIQGKTPKGGKKKRKKNTGKHQSQNLNQHFYYSGVDFPVACSDVPSSSVHSNSPLRKFYFSYQIKKENESEDEVRSEDFLRI